MLHLNLRSNTKLHDSKDKTIAFTLKIEIWPPSWISGKAAEVVYVLLTLTNRVLKKNIKHFGTKNMTSVYSSA